MTDAVREVIARALKPFIDDPVLRHAASSAILSALREGGWAVERAGERWQHVKRGTFYHVIGQGNAQVTSAIRDMEPVIIYEAEANGSLWVRPATEFYDGRFVCAMIARSEG